MLPRFNEQEESQTHFRAKRSQQTVEKGKYLKCQWLPKSSSLQANENGCALQISKILFSHPNKTRSQDVTKVCFTQMSLTVQGAAFWPENSFKGNYNVHDSGDCTSQETGNAGLYVLG